MQTRSSHLLKQSYLELVAQDHVQTPCNYLQGLRLHNLPEQPPQPRLVALPVKKRFPDDQTKPSLFQVVPNCLIYVCIFYPVLT